MRFKFILPVIALVFYSSSVFAQEKSSWLKNLDVELKYTNYNTWRRYLDNDRSVLKDDDGQSYSFGLIYSFNEKLFVQTNYHRSSLYNVDLASSFKLGGFSTSVGRRFNIFKKVGFEFKGGFSVLSYPLYQTWTTTLYLEDVVVSRNVQRVFKGVGAFRFWTLGMAAAYPVSEELSIGGEVNWHYSISSGTGATLAGIFLRMKLFN